MCCTSLEHDKYLFWKNISNSIEIFDVYSTRQSLNLVEHDYLYVYVVTSKSHVNGLDFFKHAKVFRQKF